MPTYEYSCEECKVTFDIVKSIHSKTSSHKCDKCGNDCNNIISGGQGYIIPDPTRVGLIKSDDKKMNMLKERTLDVRAIKSIDRVNKARSKY